jgi:hypothetical protein
MTQTIALELNEINFEFVQAYIKAGELPNLARLLDRHGLIVTEAEKEYPFLEPWIQWPTVYTGLSYGEHGIFRLGDSVEANHVQIWEYLESHGLSVGAVSPMNAVNRCSNPAFFLPDPWTETKISAEPRVEKLYACLKRLINDNASDQRPMAETARELLPLAMRYTALKSAGEYLRVLRHARAHKWSRAAILDRLLADVFLALWRQHKPDFASLFLNAGAHIQHHHLYDSDIYHGDRANPSWYSSAAESDIDPLLLIFRVYDKIVRDFMALPNTRLLVTTGLSQFPNEREFYQYRLVAYEETMRTFGLSDFEAHQRMSRDFLLTFADERAAKGAEALIEQIHCGGQQLFSIDNRGASLFCQVAYHGEPEGLSAVVAAGKSADMRDQFALVSIENGLHRTLGYHIDSGLDAATANALPRQPLTSLFDRVAGIALSGANKGVRMAASA